MKTIITLGVIGIFFVLAISLVGCGIGISNRDIGLRNQFAAETTANQADYDNLWKTISQKYQLSQDYKKGFVEVVQAVTQGRQGGSLFKSTQEAMPGLDPSIYKDVMATIEGKRNSFESHQIKLADIKREEDDIRLKFPGSFIVGGRSPLEVKLVTSDRTNNAFQSGSDNDTTLK